MSKTDITSYERVYRLLSETSTCKDVWAAALRDLDECRIERVKWSLRQGPDASNALATFYFTSGFAWREDQTAADVNAKTFLTNDMCEKILKVHFGSNKDVKTFNCSVRIVCGGGVISRKNEYGRRGQEYQDSFGTWLQEHFIEKVGDKLQTTTNRLWALVSDMKATEEFAKARHEALVSFCKDDITKALLPWHSMDQQTLQDAWDQFICTAIMRT